MKISLRNIDKNNWEECIKLSVSDHQRSFVATNAYSLVQAHYEENLFPMGIYREDTLVGFLMYDYDNDDDMWGMCRLMVDSKYQNQGIGEASILKLFDIILEKYGHVDFYTSVDPDNVIAIKLYEKLGFINTNKIIEDELLLTTKL